EFGDAGFLLVCHLRRDIPDTRRNAKTSGASSRGAGEEEQMGRAEIALDCRNLHGKGTIAMVGCGGPTYTARSSGGSSRRAGSPRRSPCPTGYAALLPAGAAASSWRSPNQWRSSTPIAVQSPKSTGLRPINLTRD